MAASPGDAPFPRVFEVDASDLGHHPDLLQRLERQQMHAIRVRGTFDRALVDAAVARLDAGGFGVRGAAAPPEGEPVQLFGLPSQWASPDLAEYLSTARRFRAACARLWPDLDYEAHIRGVLQAMSRERPVEVMRSAGGEPYTPSTIRRIAPGGSIPPHAERHQLDFAGCSELRGAIEEGAVMSFFTLLARPESGGRLAMYGMTADDFASKPELASGQDALIAELATRRRGEIALEAGDTLVLDSGRYFHAVGAVEGARPRWTIGGFLAPSRGGGRAFYWG